MSNVHDLVTYKEKLPSKNVSKILEKEDVNLVVNEHNKEVPLGFLSKKVQF